MAMGRYAFYGVEHANHALNAYGLRVFLRVVLSDLTFILL